MNSGKLEIRLKPRSKNDRITVREDGLIDIAVTSPPLDDRANAHLLAVIAGRLGVPKSDLSIIRGGHSRNKVVAVEGMATEEAKKRMREQ